jgi:UDP-4-amino-4-deoxy-L-arabinose-oxoglutarate aminotransferase
MGDSTPKVERLPFARPVISEAAIAEVVAVLRSGWITTGPKCAEFEKRFAEFVNAPHAIAVCSATAALDLVFAELLEPGDEVILPSLNWVSAPNMVECNGGRCVFVEVDEAANMNIEATIAAITPKTRAILPVHFAGAPIDLAPLRQAIAGRNIVIVEDAAHAAGARSRGKVLGSESDIAIFSFHPNKNMTTAEGGMITCRDPVLAERLRLMRFHGIRKEAWKEHGRGGGDAYDVVDPARKYNLPDTLAALGLHQLAELNGFNEVRRHLAERYLAKIGDIPAFRPLAATLAPGDLHAWHLFAVEADTDALGCSRREVCVQLEALGIGTGYHFPAVHPQEFYANKYPGVSLPMTERLGRRLISLPLWAGMTEADVDRVVAALHSVAKQAGVMRG